MTDEQKRIADIITRMVQIKDEKNFTALVEISLTDRQIEIMGKTILIFANPEYSIKEHLMRKCHGKVLISNGRFTSREEQPDFQALVDFAFNCLEDGLKYDDIDNVKHGY